MSGIIAIVGRPNVGKSALFNRIVGKRIAIVHDEPGVTRDRVSAEGEWHGRPFTLIDTGGIGLNRGEKTQNVITQAAFDQVKIAIDAADVIILTVNVQDGVVPLDREVAARLRESGKKVLVAANKADNQTAELAATEFSDLAFDQIFPVSAIHGRGLDNLVSTAVQALPPWDGVQPPTVGRSDALNIAIVGRPNVGKSSIINALTNSDRVVVSPIPGTTRDAVDVPFEVDTEGVRQKYVLIDTAGLRQERRIDDSVEFFSVKRTENSISRADIVVFVMDVENGVLQQDKKIAGKIVEEKKGCIIVVNKWDLVEEDVRKTREKEVERRNKKERSEGEKKLTTLSEFAEWVQNELFFIDYAPVIFTSAKTGFHLDRLLEAIRYVASQLKQKIPTSLVNRTLQDAIEGRQPISSQGHRLKFYYATQVREAPPTFLLFVNRDELFSVAYDKYLGKKMREAFGYEGCPIILVPKARPKTVESFRKFNKPGGKLATTKRRTAADKKEHPARSGKNRAGKSPGKKGSRTRR